MKNMTRVIFRKWENEIIAIFPDITHHGYLNMAYVHSEHHVSCDMANIIKNSCNATITEYESLKWELENDMGYNLEIIESVNKEAVIGIV